MPQRKKIISYWDGYGGNGFTCRFLLGLFWWNNQKGLGLFWCCEKQLCAGRWGRGEPVLLGLLWCRLRQIMMDKPFASTLSIGTFLVRPVLEGFYAGGAGFCPKQKGRQVKIGKSGEIGAVEKRGRRFYWDGIVVCARFIFHTKQKKSSDFGKSAVKSGGLFV